MSNGYQTNAKTAGPWVDIDLANLCANFAMIRDQAPGAETAAVVKCDAYGLGLNAIATALAEREICRSFFVAYPEEGAALRLYLNSSEPDIYVFNGPLPQTMSLFESARLTPVLNSLEQAEKWASRRAGVPAVVHIDTGMNRLGARVDEVSDIAALPNLNVTLAMSHLAYASAPDESKNKQQRDLFIEAAQTLSRRTAKPFRIGRRTDGKGLSLRPRPAGHRPLRRQPVRQGRTTPETRRTSARACRSNARRLSWRNRGLWCEPYRRKNNPARNGRPRLWRRLSCAQAQAARKPS